MERPAAEPSRNGTVAERPTAAAQLKISVMPARRVQAGRLAPALSAKHSVTTVLGIVVSTFTGTAGAVLTVGIYHRFVLLALAELGLGFLAAVLISLVDYRHSRIDLEEKRLEAEISRLRLPSGKASRRRLSSGETSHRRLPSELDS